jgi:hypothetical protein
MGSGKTELVADEIAEQQPGLNRPFVHLPVDGDLYIK